MRSLVLLLGALLLGACTNERPSGERLVTFTPDPWATDGESPHQLAPMTTALDTPSGCSDPIETENTPTVRTMRYTCGEGVLWVSLMPDGRGVADWTPRKGFDDGSQHYTVRVQGE